MNARAVRLKKEAGALFWPWCAVTIAGALPLVPGSRAGWTEGIGFTGFFVGFPLLATLSLGNEFQHRTLSLLLSQPVSRMEIWREKLSVTIVATLSAALVFYYGLGWRSVFQQDPKQGVLAGVYVIAIMASATFWTLLARSTLGGLALNVLAIDIFLASIVIFGRVLGYWTVENWEETVGPHSAKTVILIAALCYAGVMFWLGGRKLARLQVTGGMAGDDLLMAGPNVLPDAVAERFRCRPTGAVLNLIRKELRLLRPLWLITLLSVLGWTCLTMSGLVPERGSTRNHSGDVAVALVVMSSLLIAILAGSLSLGEERTAGTHSWHLTLPVSSRRQWLIKLVMALFAGFVCAALLPVLALIAGGIVFGSPFMFLDPHAGMGWLFWVSLLTFASFWCACAVNGTVRAALWLFPVITALFFAGKFGERGARELMDLVISRFDLFTDFRFTNAVSNLQSLVMGATPTLVATLLLVPILPIAVIQSYRLFRAQLQDSALSVVRNLAPLAIVAFLCSFSLVAFSSFAYHAREQMGTLFRETHEAIEKTQPGAEKPDAAYPLKLTVDDLAKAFPLSERTRRWLRNSTITVNPDEAHPGRYGRGRTGWGASFAPGGAYSRYLATIHLESGSDCTVSFEAGRGFSFGILGGVCE